MHTLFTRGGPNTHMGMLKNGTPLDHLILLINLFFLKSDPPTPRDAQPAALVRSVLLLRFISTRRVKLMSYYYM